MVPFHFPKMRRKIPILVQIAPPVDAGYIIEEVGEEPEGNAEEEPMEEEDLEEWEIGPEDWEIEPIKGIEPVQKPEVMDILFDSGYVPPPPYETDIGMHHQLLIKSLHYLKAA
ncbi:hypothetical protein RHMOL_Rhmol11G0023300 [Rhododendron molle]|uniref:Uncharacterized protein n=1 Tax=Rhododendron molle TaxID=49168 RepID=A0ACC0LPG9_RHOML|nr:hypothetical protein RHMOL_Rhmol11G0023300 [Rhododendron molle]